MVSVVLPVASTSQPSMRSSLPMVFTSASCGTFFQVDGPLGKSAAASSGRAAFLAPLIGMRPTNRLPPSTTILSIRLPWDVSRPLAGRNVSAGCRIAGGSGRGFCGQRDDEGRALARTRIERDATTVALGRRVDEWQALPRSLPARLGREERLEDVR